MARTPSVGRGISEGAPVSRSFSDEPLPESEPSYAVEDRPSSSCQLS